MPATLHLARFSPREAGRMLRSNRRYRRHLEAVTPELEIANLFMLAPFSPVSGGFPAPTTFGLFCGFTAVDARDAFLDDDARLRPFRGGAKETWGVALDVARVTRGTHWRGWTPTADDVPPLRGDEPTAIITHGMLRLRHAPVFSFHNGRIADLVRDDPAVTLVTGVLNHPLARSTFSIWRSKGDMVRFAHGPDSIHRPVKAPSLDTPWLNDDFFARMRPVASTGTWYGADPLAVARGMVAA